MLSLYLGMSGYSYKHWKETFYPKGVSQKKWLTYYADHFNSVEINATFYRHFPITVFQNWHDRTPSDFRVRTQRPQVDHSG